MKQPPDMHPRIFTLPTWVLSSAAARSHQILQHRLAEAGVTGYEYRCLAALGVTDHLSQIDLGEAAALDPRDVTHTVRALEERGLVSRTRDPGHGRRQIVSLTVEGRRTAGELVEVMAEVQNAVFGDLSSADRTALLELLERVGRR